MKLFDIHIYTHYFKVTNMYQQGAILAKNFLTQFVQMGYNRDRNLKKLYVPVKVFAAADRERTEFRFHINTFQSFIEHLERVGIRPDRYSIVREPLYTPYPIKLQVKPEISLRDYQIPVVKYLLENIETQRAKFIGIQTGGGKSLVSTYAIAENNQRVVVMVRPLFIEKWADDFTKYTKISKKEILVVQGNSHLKGLIDMARDPGFNFPVVIVSNKTFQNYITRYELSPRGCIDEYGIAPDEFYKHLRAGVRLIDEVHLDFHLNFKFDLYTNIPWSISLSATLLHDTEFLENMYKIMFPTDMRYNGGVLDKYADAYCVFYTHKSDMRIQTSEWGSKTYSHNAFEKSILKRPSYTKSYFNLIDNTIEVGYLKKYRKGDRLAIFVSTIAMATELTTYLQSKYPDMDIRRYVENDPYENLLDADIRVTTMLSAGTGHDIAELTTVILTVAVSSIQANIQTFGRLRKLPDRATRFYYLTDMNIPKHMEYHEKKKAMLLYRAKSYRDVFYPGILSG